MDREKTRHFDERLKHSPAVQPHFESQRAKRFPGIIRDRRVPISTRAQRRGRAQTTPEMMLLRRGARIGGIGSEGG